MDREVLQQLIRIVTETPEMAQSTERRLVWLKSLLQGLPRIQQILLNINYEGGSKIVATGVVMGLKDAGSYVAGHSYLLDFVNVLSGQVSEEADQEILHRISESLARELAARNARPLAPAPRLSAGAWRGKDTTTDYQSFKEKIIGENTLRPFSYVRLAVAAGAAVCRISGPAGMGTGFLIASNLVMTNNHVVPDSDGLADTELWFRYEENANGTSAATISVKPKIGGIFFTEAGRTGELKDRDVTVFELDTDAVAKVQEAGIKPLTLARASAREGDHVAIIQHPGGLPLRISFENSRVQYADNDIVDYTTTTESGSSGSPVLNDAFEVVGLHREGGHLQVPDTDLLYYRNRGTSIRSLREWLKANGLLG